MTQVIVVGCGIVGAAIAYELSQVSGLAITVLEAGVPAQAATGAALGVLMGAISQKVKGNHFRMRLTSIRRYNTWIPALEASTGRRIPFNQEGILRLCFAGEDMSRWQKLAEVRESQGWRLEICDRTHLATNYPQLKLDGVIGAVYSPDDRQVDPTALTLALVDAAKQNGVTFQFNTTVTQADSHSRGQLQQCQKICTTNGSFPVDWLVISAGLGSTPLTADLQQPVDIRPVLGQAVHLQLQEAIGKPNLQPVITGDDVHIVPLGDNEYWIGATVEFPDSVEAKLIFPPQQSDAALAAVMQQATSFCPALASGTVVRTWSGLRPRPEGRPAPIIEPLSGYSNVLLATGHYRNGVLLAPATAEKIRQMIGEG
ncbi:FAD-binding oxidoreductase [Kovacikia minuta CCNUW1]|uniref:NAD(P)/FAD-dependent oxidoreductase n=1 Tax=Kovacikia minuta TaxID=2931930 RepID=UPI001CCECD71|nr:FAD-dependent oxidoreductase [Kovacikia minuta]UBF24232.1 FAD-binding oxidoreductase [Kovacikia minuta CCNUW1]